jgi:hypothetical protein
MTNEDDLYKPQDMRLHPGEWQDLSHIEIGNLWSEHKEVYSFAVELQKKLKEKNHGL